MELILQKREIYGSILYYPVNDLAKEFVAIMKQKTLSKRQVEILSKLGFKITLKQDEI
ncbi:MAG: hypothetical protein KA413_00420 [Candidatus Methylopumilus sp.]|nr:hypothetical protein [Candidatus Methylopumilus sp.]